MTETTKEILEKYQVRKSKEQKTAFIHYVEQVAKNYGYDVQIEKGNYGVRNIVIGNPDTAKVLYTAHYDTCTQLPFPNFITPKCFALYVLYQLLIVGSAYALVLLLWLPLKLMLPFVPAVSEILRFVEIFWLQIGTVFLIGLFFGFPPNKHTANDNTSGVTAVLDIMKELPQDQRSKVAFVLFDLEESGILGSKAFASKHKSIKKNTLVINFDCVSDGKTMLFALNKTTEKYGELLGKAFVSSDDVVVDIDKVTFYPSDNTSFKNGIGVVALNKSKFFGMLYMDKIHTPKDVVYREENIQFLTDGAVKLTQLL